ncbi:hypothetical protein HGRIS_014620 [Hohenbuehelia grisea]|uniref:Uncharacterized protein n=1 Tax=Hohenbuehelia grisea TaxID=104357 RepID=A0ABR3JW85_9AGAR
MPSFATLTAYATLAFAALTSAAPHSSCSPDLVDAGIAAIAALPPIEVANAKQDVHKRDLVDVEALLKVITGKIAVANAEQNVHQRDFDAVDIDALVEVITGPVSAFNAKQNVARQLDGTPVAPILALLGAAKLPRSELRSLPVILADVQAKVKTHTDKLAALVSAEVTVEVLTPIVKEISAILISATAEVKLLIGLPLEVVLAVSGKVLTITECAHIVVGVVELILLALAGVLKVVAVAKVDVILPLLTGVGLLVGELLACIFLAVHGLLAVVLTLICKIVPTLFRLKLDAVIVLFGL